MSTTRDHCPGWYDSGVSLIARDENGGGHTIDNLRWVLVYGETDQYGRNVAKDMVHAHDLHATILHLLGFEHEKLTFRHAGRDFRLTDVSDQRLRRLLAGLRR